MSKEKKELIPVQAVQDNDCHWYVVPQDQIDEFNRLLDGGETTEDRFIELFSQYMTGGALNNTQLYACPGKTDEQGGVLTESNPGKYVVFHSEGPMPDLISQPIPENLKLSALEMVEAFHKAFNCPVLKTPGIPDMMGFQHKNFIAELEMILEKMKALNDRSRVALRAKLILEEFIELYAALFKGEIVKALDGLSDLLYVTYGTHHELGTAPIAKEAFREVHRSNMSKLNGDGTPIIRNDGKVLKGPNFTPPDLAGIIARALKPDVTYKTGVSNYSDTPVMKAAAEFKEQINHAAEMGKTLTPDVFNNCVTSIDMNREDKFTTLIAVNDIELVKTCDACPEQYDAFYKGIQVGYLRLRHGHFRVDYKGCGGVTIYQASPAGDGVFYSDERGNYLTKAKVAIVDKMMQEINETGGVHLDQLRGSIILKDHKYQIPDNYERQVTNEQPPADGNY